MSFEHRGPTANTQQHAVNDKEVEFKKKQLCYCHAVMQLGATHVCLDFRQDTHLW